MATVILVRHGRTTANTSGVLAGRRAASGSTTRASPRRPRTAERLAVVPLVAVVTSPLERCRQTAAGDPQGAAGHAGDRDRARASPSATTGRGRARRSGTWPRSRSGRPCRPSRPRRRSPSGESMSAMQARSVAAVRRLDALVRGRARPRRGVGGGQPRRHHQVGARRRPGHAPRPVPAAPGRPGVGLDRALHRRPAPTCWPPTPTPATCPGSGRRRRRPAAASRPQDAAVGGGAGPAAAP